MVLGLAGCSSTAVSGPQAAGATLARAATPVATSHAPADYTGGISTREVSPDGLLTDFYADGQTATLRLPQATGPTPLVVVVPGGGWVESDPTDYQPLAEFLTAAGLTTSLITYDTAANGAQFPKPIDDVACAIRWSAVQVNALDYPATEVYVVGHSAGGHLAVEAAVTGDRFGTDCPWPPVTVTGVAGLAGAYDLVPISTLPEGRLFAGGGTPEERLDYSPIAAVNDPDNAIPSSLKVLLLSGSSDVIVPAVQPEELTAALRSRGIEPTTKVLPLEHNMGFPLTLEIAPIIAEWVLGDTYTPSPSPTPVDTAAPAASAPPQATSAPAPSAPAG
jgi:acetyl esterase/lipase